MIKKYLLIVLAFFMTVQAQDEAVDSLDLVFQELAYDVGMNLTNQKLIIDKQSAKNALLSLYQDVTQVAQIVDLYILFDAELNEKNITTPEAFIDFELEDEDEIVQAGIVWLVAYQKLFIIFKALHENNCSFQVWCDDKAYFSGLVEGQEPSNLAYADMWHASCAVFEAQADFELALKDFQE